MPTTFLPIPGDDGVDGSTWAPWGAPKWITSVLLAMRPESTPRDRTVGFRAPTRMVAVEHKTVMRLLLSAGPSFIFEITATTLNG